MDETCKCGRPLDGADNGGGLNMDALTAKLRARDRAATAWETWQVGFFARRFRWSRYPLGRKAALASLVFAAQALHARRGTLNLPSTQRAIARYVF